MRGVVLGSIFLLTACQPARKPPEMAPNDPNSVDPSDNASSKPADDDDKATPAAKPKTAKPADDDAPAAKPKASDEGPHVPATLGGPAYDRATLEVTLTRASRQVKANCGSATDENGAVTGPWGKTTFIVKLGHNGHSKGGTIPAPYDGKPTGNCVVKAFTNLIYAPFAGDDADVSWPVEFSKP
jgi:hypothetical protein